MKQEKLTLKERLLLIAFAALANGVFFGLLFGLEKKWFGFVLFTGLVFGGIAYISDENLWKVRGLLVFGGLLAIHIAACFVYVNRATKFPATIFFLAPFEAGLVGFILGTLGGVRPRLLRHRKYRAGGEFWTDRNNKQKQNRA